MSELPYTYKIGRHRYTHAGYAAHKVIGRLDKPMEMIGGIRQSAEEALEAVERLGQGHAAYRVVQSGLRAEPRELIKRGDLPITVSLNPNTIGR
jgi:hypothetical protein